MYCEEVSAGDRGLYPRRICTQKVDTLRWTTDGWHQERTLGAIFACRVDKDSPFWYTRHSCQDSVVEEMGGCVALEIG
jgi:hypothetical protein